MKRLSGIMLIVMGICVALFSIGKPLFLPAWDHKRGQQAGDSLTFPSAEVNQIQIDASSAEVYISTAETDQLVLELKKNEGSHSKLQAVQNGGHIGVTVNQPPFNFLGNIIALFSGQLSFQEELHVSLPRAYQGSLYVKSSSGAMNINGLAGLKVLDIKVSSGSVNIEDVSVESFRYDGSSGRLNVNGLQAERNQIKISSGKVSLERMAGEIHGESSSGSVTIDMVSLEAPLKWRGSSGTVTLRLPEESSFELTASTSSGSIHSDFPLVVHSQSNRELKGKVGHGGVPIELRISSGKINIERKNR